MKGVAWLVLVVLFAQGAAAQIEGRRPAPPDVSAVGNDGRGFVGGTQPLQLLCVQWLLDQATGGCLQASSIPTFGKLFPYPGTNNTFDASMGAFVGGGANNSAQSQRATVAGGYSNMASGHHSTIAGGQENVASGFVSLVGGGSSNTASSSWDTIAGGYSNTASGPSGTVSGGQHNIASGARSTVGGGEFNEALWQASTIPGGQYNTTLGAFSFAAGRHANAIHHGSFVWGDSQITAVKTSTTEDQFNVYATGGVRFFSNSAATSGVLLAPGGGSWSAVSDRARKENIEPINVRSILDHIVAMPLTSWNYKDQDDSIRHIGPMAQDFHDAFGLGLGETTIDTVDADGISMAAIQGLNAKLDEVVAKQQEQIDALLERISVLEVQLGTAQEGKE